MPLINHVCPPLDWESSRHVGWFPMCPYRNMDLQSLPRCLRPQVAAPRREAAKAQSTRLFGWVVRHQWFQMVCCGGQTWGWTWRSSSSEVMFPEREHTWEKMGHRLGPQDFNEPILYNVCQQPSTANSRRTSDCSIRWHSATYWGFWCQQSAAVWLVRILLHELNVAESKAKTEITFHCCFQFVAMFRSLSGTHCWSVQQNGQSTNQASFLRRLDKVLVRFSELSRVSDSENKVVICASV